VPPGAPDTPASLPGFARGLDAARIAAAADDLRSRGACRGSIVAWLALNQIAMIETLAACRQIGAVLLPLNWRFAAPELVQILDHAGAGLLIAPPPFETVAAQIVSAAKLTNGPAPGVEEGDLLLVYTSGTTGQPKGAMHTARGVQANIDAAIVVQDFSASTRVLATLPMFHVGGLCIQTLPALAAGASLRLHQRFDADAWFDDVQQWRPTTTLLVPAVMRALIEHPRWAGADLGSLQFVNCGSQIVPRQLIEAFHDRRVPVTQVYGSTETGPVSIALRPHQALLNPGRAGWPAPGVNVRLAGDGEIELRAPNLMRAYHRSAETGLDAGGWFATGDIGVMQADGGYEIVGRKKELIISGGENIHPAEIEHLVAALPGVADCAVVGLPDARWGEVPVLVVVMRPGAAPDSGALRQACAARLARFKQPREIVFVDALPKTALGKVQKTVLAATLADRR
jgi:fatty-acyl-CoA synthase